MPLPGSRIQSALTVKTRSAQRDVRITKERSQYELYLSA